MVEPDTGMMSESGVGLVVQALRAAAPAEPRPPDDRTLADEPRNDTGNAWRFIARHGADAIWCEEAGWFVWDGKRWLRDGREALGALVLAQDTAQAIRAETDAIETLGPRWWMAEVAKSASGSLGNPGTGKEPPRKNIDSAAAGNLQGEGYSRNSRFRPAGGNPGSNAPLQVRPNGALNDSEKLATWGKGFIERIKAHGKFATSSGNAGRAEAMLRMAAPHLKRLRSDFNSTIWALTVTNGTLRLAEDGDVRFDGSHDRADMATRLAPVEYDPEAVCPKFRTYLEHVQPDREMRVFLQAYLGTCLTGEVSEQLFAVWWGGGANGKSTLLDIMRGVLGDYTLTLPVESFLHDRRKGGADASPDVAQLPGARLVTMAEPEVGARLSETLIKQATGGEPMAARELHRGFFEFHPRFKVVFSCNNRPRIAGGDEGTWRRVALVPWLVEIPKAAQDKQLARRILESEAPGVLNWLLDGFRHWRDRGGIELPEAVRVASEAYRAESDSAGEFMRDSLKVDPTGRVGGGEMYAAYEKWCKVSGIEPMNGTRLGSRLRDLGVRKIRSNGVKYEGVRLLDQLD